MNSRLQRLILLPQILVFSLLGTGQTLSEGGHAAPPQAPPQTAAAAAGSDAAIKLNDAAVARLEVNDYAGAQELAEKAVRADPQSPHAWNNLGRAYFGQGQMEEAEKAFRRQIDINPNDPYAYNNLGNVLRNTNRRDEAVAAYRKQIEVVPLDRFAHKNLGLVLARLERYSEAVEELEKAAQITPDDTQVKAVLSQAYRNTGQNDKAQAVIGSLSPRTVTTAAIYKAFLRDEAEPEPARQQARASLQMVERMFAKNLETGTPDVTGTAVSALWAMTGWSYFKVNQLDDAERYLGAAWIMSDYADIGSRLAQVYEKEQRTELAMQTYAEALAGEGSREGIRKRLLHLAGDERTVDELLKRARIRLSDRRRAIMSSGEAKPASADLILVFANGPQPEDVIFRGGSRTLFDRYMAAIKGYKFAIVYPDATPQHVAREAVLGCGGGGCAVALVPLSTDRPYVVSFELKTPK
jgi:tetratricopeptide (TPR) repeat protein